MPTVHDKVTRIIAVKAAIKAAIEAKGPTVGSIPFDEYALKIAEIADLSAAQAAVEAVNGETSVDLDTAIALTASTKLAIETAIEAADIDVPALTPFADYADYVADIATLGAFFIDSSNKIMPFGYNVYAGSLDVVIPDSVATVGAYAFFKQVPYRTISVNSVIFGAGVTAIETYAFYGNNLTSVVIPNTVTAIALWAFFDNKLIALTLPTNAGYTTITDRCFAVNLLPELTVPAQVTSIEDYAFYLCPLIKIIIPANVTVVATAMGLYAADFKTFYDAGGQLAGTYEYAAGAWSKTA